MDLNFLKATALLESVTALLEYLDLTACTVSVVYPEDFSIALLVKLTPRVHSIILTSFHYLLCTYQC